jgi:hypothetical protein
MQFFENQAVSVCVSIVNLLTLPENIQFYLFFGQKRAEKTVFVQRPFLKKKHWEKPTEHAQKTLFFGLKKHRFQAVSLCVLFFFAYFTGF